MRSEMNEFDHLILALFKQQRERPEKHHYPQNVKQHLTDFLGISEQARKCDLGMYFIDWQNTVQENPRRLC